MRKIAARLKSWRGLPRASRAEWFAFGALSVIALLLRLPAFDGRPLWIDELWRATLILDPQFWHQYFYAPNSQTAITSPIYAILIKLLAMFSVAPTILRLPSLAAGTFSGLLGFALIRKSGGSLEIAICAGLTFALNQWFIDFSNEMKPYMFEVCVHLACMYGWLAIVMAPAPTLRNWALYFAVLVFAALSTPTMVFILPASGLSLIARFLIAKDMRNSRICIVGFAGLGAFVLANYFLAWRHGADQGMLSFWSDGFVPAGENYFHFLGAQLAAMWQAAFQTHTIVRWQSALPTALLLAALAVLLATGRIKREPLREILLFYIVFLATLCAINFMNIWPLGASRQNLFLYCHAIIFLILLVGQLPYAGPVARIAFIAGGLALAWHAHSKQGRDDYHRLVSRLASNEGAPIERSDLVVEDFSYGGLVGKTINANCARGKTTIIENGYMETAREYYVRFDSAHRQGAALLNSNCVQIIPYYETNMDAARMREVLARATPKPAAAWVLYTHVSPVDLELLRKAAQPFGQISQSKAYEGAGYFQLVMTPPPK